MKYCEIDMRVSWRDAYGALDGVCPEFDGWSDVIKTDNYVVVRDWKDIFTAFGKTWEAHCGWRDKYDWLEKTGPMAIPVFLGCIVEWMRGAPVPEGIYCLPWEAVRDFNGICMDFRREWPDGIDWLDDEPSFNRIAFRHAVHWMCDVYQPHERDVDEFVESPGWRRI